MSANTHRTAARRPRLIAATAVAAASIAGSLALPAAAHADSGDISVKWSAVTPSAPLTRGGATASTVLTVSNDSGKPAEYEGTVFGIPDGPSPVNSGDVKITVTPVSAPATDSLVSAEDAAALVTFMPHGTKPGAAFAVPAHSHLTWKFTVGLTSRFPANDAGVNLASLTEIAAFKATPEITVGKVTEKFGPAAKVGYGTPGTSWLEVDNNSGGAFSSKLRTLLDLSGGHAPGDESMRTVNVDVKVNGAWVRLRRIEKTSNEWWLPEIPAGFAKGQKHRYDLRFSSDQKRAVSLTIGQLMSQVSLATGNPSPVAEAEGSLELLGYSGDGTPTPTPSSSAPAGSTPTATPSPTATTGTAAPSAATTTPTGTLAHTGANDRTRTIGLAAGALVLAGGLLTVVGLRRRRGASHL